MGRGENGTGERRNDGRGGRGTEGGVYAGTKGTGEPFKLNVKPSYQGNDREKEAGKATSWWLAARAQWAGRGAG